MSSIECKSNDSVPAVRSKDGLIFMSFSVLALGIVLSLCTLSASSAVNPTDFELATVSP